MMDDFLRTQPGRGSAKAQRRPGRRRPRLDPRAGASGASRFDRLDVICAVLALVGLYVCLRATSRYPLGPALGLLLPTVRAAASPSYRGRIRRWAGAQWGRVRAHAAGVGPIPWLAALAFVAVPAFVFDVANGRTEGAVDTRPVILTAVSLVRQGDWDLGEFARADGRDALHDHRGQLAACFHADGARIYSAYPHGMVPFAVPVIGLAHLCGTDLDDRLVQLRLQKVAAALVMALALGAFFLTAARLGHPRAAAVATAYLTAASGMFTTVGLGLWQQGGVALWLMAVLLVEFHARGRPASRGVLIQGLGCALMLTCRPTAAIPVAAFGAWVLMRSPRRAVATAAVAAVAYLPCVALYWTLYDNLLGPSTVINHSGRHLWRFGRLEGLAGVLVSPSRGLFVYQPWALLAPAVALPRVRARAGAAGGPAVPRGWAGFCTTVVALHAALIASWFDWSGGWCWGSRLMTDVLPLLGLLCVRPIAALGASPRGRRLLIALGLVGVLTHLPCAFLGSARWNAVTDHAGDLWSWSRAPFFYLPR